MTIMSIRLIRDNRRLRENNERINRNLSACIEHLKLLQKAMNGDALYMCQLCGARPEDDHTDDCELTRSAERLAALGLETPK